MGVRPVYSPAFKWDGGAQRRASWPVRNPPKSKKNSDPSHTDPLIPHDKRGKIWGDHSCSYLKIWANGVLRPAERPALITLAFGKTIKTADLEARILEKLGKTDPPGKDLRCFVSALHLHLQESGGSSQGGGSSPPPPPPLEREGGGGGGGAGEVGGVREG